jgi:serine/threonine protein phosphatase PrpC
MSSFETAHTVEGYRSDCEDCVAVFNDGERTVIVVADGAGGSGGGRLAAEIVVREARSHYASIDRADQWPAELRRIDQQIAMGETTAVVVDLTPDGISGASVGDTQAWLIHEGIITVLTKDQNRKPLLGSGDASPVHFAGPPLAGILLVATDGFCNYVKQPALMSMIPHTEFYSLPRKCIEMVRLPSGELWDDVGIVVCRVRP